MSEYGEDWEKELKKRPKDFLVNFIKNSLLKIKKLEKQNEELIRLLCLYIDSDFENGTDDLSGEACDYLIKIKQKPIEEILKEAE